MCLLSVVIVCNACIVAKQCLLARKTSAIQCKRNIFKFGIEQRWGRKNLRFSTNKSPYVGNGEKGPRLLLITNRKSHKSFQMTWKSSTSIGWPLPCQSCNIVAKWYTIRVGDGTVGYVLTIVIMSVWPQFWMQRCCLQPSTMSVDCSVPYNSVSHRSMYGTAVALGNCHLSATGSQMLVFGYTCRRHDRPTLLTAGLLVIYVLSCKMRCSRCIARETTPLSEHFVAVWWNQNTIT